MSLQRDATLFIKSIIFENSNYFQNAKREVAERNNVALKIVSTSGLVVTLLFFPITQLIYGKWIITWHYWLLVPMLFTFSAFSFVYGKRKQKNYFTIQTACILFITILLMLFINISIFPYPEKPESLVSAFLILMPLFFIVRPWIITCIIIIGGIAFCILSHYFKVSTSAGNDIFSTILSMIFSLVVLSYTSKLRANDFQLREKYRKLSRTDLLSGLLNKRSYEAQCQRRLLERNMDSSCALFVFDIDDFKQINDKYGHIVGDRAIEMVGEILSSYFRADDLVGRIGGDEYSAYVGTQGTCETINLRAEKILNELKERSKKELNIELTMSLGIAVLERGEISYEDLFSNADKALYMVKQSNQSGWKINVIR